MNISKISAYLAGICFAIFASAFSFGAVNSKAIEYSANGKTFEGLLVTPDKPRAKSPTILLVHNWMGVTEETKKQASRFAELGYTVFAADIYGKGVRPKDGKEAGEQAGLYKTNRILFRENLNLALSSALQQPHTNKNNVAVVGYCFGGTGALELARSGANLKAIISFHGGLDSPAPADGKNIKGKVLALHGADDPFVQAKDVAAFESEMSGSQVNYLLIKYPGAVHSFTEVGAGTDNTKGAAYNEAADKQSFEEAKKLLASTLN